MDKLKAAFAELLLDYSNECAAQVEEGALDAAEQSDAIARACGEVAGEDATTLAYAMAESLGETADAAEVLGRLLAVMPAAWYAEVLRAQVSK